MKNIFTAIFIVALIGGTHSAFGSNPNRQTIFNRTLGAVTKFTVKKAEWREQGITLDVPADFRETKPEMGASYDIEEGTGYAKLWQGFSAQSKKSGFNVMITIKSYRTMPEKSPKKTLENDLRERITNAKGYKGKPDVYQIIDGYKGIFSLWDTPKTNDIQISWITYRLYAGHFQQVWIGVEGKAYGKQKMTQLLNSIKFAR